ncbi:hypothetical protein V6N11_071218 [Hibiscus sabdariffa]|uniref:Uncharacterized protein n=1 Tax=Hibiscus sabdariffa TaxID=183260 RepID=A0ABR2U098_9ROSI
MMSLEGRTKAVDEARKTAKLRPTFLGIVIEYSSKKRKSSFSPIAKSFNMNMEAQLDEEIARMFYTGGLPFNLARNPHY